MSPFFLIEAGKLHERAGLICNSHMTLFPTRFKDWLQALISPRRRAPKQQLRADSTLDEAALPKRITLSLHLHPSDTSAMREAARKVGMGETEFCALAIYRASRSVIEPGACCKIV
ncbi:hypothetical protein [Paraburkholderia sp. ZP32-5]|uniref:hypothetical protein n=1 Tax=Paraburkholderia sp. ZP32-5 TaxID=2883245 RepID=UPI001F36E1AB|nr:hypothetical protein [Paraburkholderia sp. ZP32-5]